MSNPEKTQLQEPTMLRRFLTGLALCAALLPSIASAQLVGDPERAAVQRVIVAYAENIQAGTYAPIEALLTPGAHILVGNLALHSFAEYRDVLQPEVARFPNLRYTHTGIETIVRGNVAWSNFRWQMASPSGNPANVVGRGTMILEKINNQWMIAHIHFSQ